MSPDICSPILWTQNSLRLLDQRALPLKEVYLEVKNLEDCIFAIKDMVVRGAPCIGFTGIFGMVLWMQDNLNFNLSQLRLASDLLISARPTAVNLKFEVELAFSKAQDLFIAGKSQSFILQEITKFGLEQLEKSYSKNLTMAKIGVSKLMEIYGDQKLNLMTHCNTGFLACGSLGTALGVISYAHSLGKVNHVFADETRPYMQGSRLTAFELLKEKIPHSIVVEGAASYIMSSHKIHGIFVGADRIALNGDTANKIGTSTLAIVASYYKVPFYVVAPISSFDLNTKTGREIEIEMRNPQEIKEMNGVKISPNESPAINPSFDITPHQLITGIICENGFINPQVVGELANIVGSKS